MLERDLKGRGIKDPRVLEAMAETPRELFVGEGHRGQAYSDGPLPINCGQTISQPYIVALMTEELKITTDSEVLEIGTGSGYQTAILCKLAKKVYTVERFEELSQSAQKILSELGNSFLRIKNSFLNSSSYFALFDECFYSFTNSSR